MKKMKQILAILGIVLILGINVLLVFSAGAATEDNAGMFNAAIVAVIMIPVLLWIYMYIFKLVKKYSKTENVENTDNVENADAVDDVECEEKAEVTEASDNEVDTNK